MRGGWRLFFFFTVLIFLLKQEPAFIYGSISCFGSVHFYFNCRYCCCEINRYRLQHLSLFTCFSLLPGGRLPFLSGRQHIHVPGAGVCAQCRRPAGQSATACSIQGAANTRASPTKHTELTFLRSRPHCCLPKGCPRAHSQPAQG